MAIETVGIVGAGTMGGGIAINLAQHGFRVVLHDARPERRAGAAVASAAGFYARAVEKGRMTADAASAARARLGVARRLAGLAGAELVIEAVFEDFDLKARLLEALSPLLRPRGAWSPPTPAACGSATSPGMCGGPSGSLACTISARRRSTRSSRWSRAKAPAPATDRDGAGLLRGQRQAAAAVPRPLWLCRQPVLLPLHQRGGGRALDAGLGTTGEIDAGRQGRARVRLPGRSR